jgi:hypothetical protein
MLGKMICTATVTLFSSLLSAMPTKEEGIKDESVSLNPSRQETTIIGQLHLYGSRYIVKDQDSKQWFILLENEALDNFLKTVGEMETCQIEGERYQFKNNRYIFPRQFTKLQTITQETLPFGLVDACDTTGQIHSEEGDGKELQDGGGGEPKVKKEKKNKKSEKKAKKAKKSKKADKDKNKDVKKNKKNGKDKNKDVKKNKKNGKDKNKDVKKNKKNGKDKDVKKNKKNGKDKDVKKNKKNGKDKSEKKSKKGNKKTQPAKA